MKPMYEHAISFQKRAKTRRDIADERYARRLERDERKAAAKVAEDAARAQRRLDRRLAKKAKRMEIAQRRALREAKRTERAVAKAAAQVQRETVRVIKATPKPRKPSLKQQVLAARERRMAKAAATPAIPPLPY